MKSPLKKSLMALVCVLTSFSAAASDFNFDGYDKAKCDAITARVKSMEALWRKANACAQDGLATYQDMYSKIAGNRSALNDPQIQAALKMVEDKALSCERSANAAIKEINYKNAEFKTNCANLTSLSALSDSSLVSKASKRELGKCVIEESSAAGCPLKVIVDGRGFPIGDGCQKSLVDAAQTLRDALKDGACL